MVGLVVVSHSRALAAGVAELVRGVSETQIPLAYAGGAGADHGELGTDATDIMEAISSVDSQGGVLVLMDLGSAILSAETAVEFLEGTLAGPVQLAAAPLVEGAVSAAVQIGLGADLATVAAEARDALAPKRDQLGEATEQIGATDHTDTTDIDDPSALTELYQVDTLHGLHARPAAALVRTVGQFTAATSIRRHGTQGWVNARSLNRVATLQIGQGDRFELRANGSDAQALLAAVRELVIANFGEERDTAQAPAAPAAAVPTDTRDERSTLETEGSQWHGTVYGQAAAPGTVTAALFVIDSAPIVFDGPDPTPRTTPLTQAAIDALVQPFVEARSQVVADLQAEVKRARAEQATERAEIAAAHETLLIDPEIETGLREQLTGHESTLARAFWNVMSALADSYRGVADSYLQARAADVEDVARRMLALLEPDSVASAATPTQPSILVAEDLLPSQTMQLDPNLVVGIVTTRGSASSHAAIIARGLGIPMIAGAQLPAGWQTALTAQAAVIDGNSGALEIAPPADRIEAVRAAMRESELQAARAREAAQRPGALADSTPFAVNANVATVADAIRAADSGADGVGLLRTEFIFLGAERVPSEDEQVDALRALVTPFGTRPVTVRLVDIGGDKALPALSLPQEANPFLGLRGVRLLIDPRYRELASAHARAVLRVAAECDLKLMVPMVATVDEIEAMRQLLEDAHRDLAAQGAEHRWPVPLGIMVETPAAALRAADLAPHCAFFSIGTNDLTQYVMAAERGNAEVAALSDGLHPAVLAAIGYTVSAAAAHNVPVSVCGELASDGEALPLLVGLGVQSVSANAAALAQVKLRLAALEPAQCRTLADRALQQTDAAAVRQIVHEASAQ